MNQMTSSPAQQALRRAVVDLGSNSVRLVIYEGEARNPVQIFNEKAVLRLARGMTRTGRLDEDAMDQAETVLHRYAAIARAMGAAPFEVLATSAVRDAENGSEFVQQDDGAHAGDADQDPLRRAGGGTLRRRRAVRHSRRRWHPGRSRRRLAGADPARCRQGGAGGDPARGRDPAGRPLRGGSAEGPRHRHVGAGDRFPSPPRPRGKDLYVSGGAFRALARIHIAQTGYPLNMVHHYTIGREEARDLAGVVSEAGRKLIERMPGVPRRRIEDLPYAAVILRRLLRATGAARVVFSANGLREGWFTRMLPDHIRAEDPLLAAGRDLTRGIIRDANLPPALVEWTTPLFPIETPAQKRLREAACWLSDVGSHEHPEYRAEQAFLRVLRQAGIGLDHHARAFLALTMALRYEAPPDAAFLAPARTLLDMHATRRAETLGVALRLAYTLSAGTPHLLAGTALALSTERLTLSLAEANGVFAGEAVLRRLERLAQMLGLEAETS